MTDAQIGRFTAFGIGDETTYGTKASSIEAIPFRDLTIDYNQNVLDNDMGYGRVENRQEGSKIGSKQTKITIGGILQLNGLDKFLLAIFGTDTKAANSPVTGMTTHTFTVDETNEPTSFTLIWEDSIQTLMSLGCRAVSLKISGVAGDWATFSAEFIGKAPSTTTETLTYSADYNLATANGEMKMASSISGLSGATAIPMSSADITISRSADPYFAFGDRDVNKVISQELEVVINGELIFDSKTQYDLFDAHTEQATQLKFTTDENVTGTTKGTITIVVAKATMRKLDVPKTLAEKLIQTFEMQGEYSLSDLSMIKTTVERVT